MASYQGPIKPGTSKKRFRETGKSVTIKSGGYHGPVRPGRDEEVFRRTGRSVIAGSTEASQAQREIERQQKIRAEKELAEKLRRENLKRIQEQRETQRQQAQQKQRQQAQQKQRQTIISSRKGFTGRVQEYDVVGKKQTPVQTKYFYRGKQTGRVYQRGEQYAEVKQPSRFKFKDEDVVIKKEGITRTKRLPKELTKEEERQHKIKTIYERQQLPAMERIKLAYKSAGKGSEVYGGIRAGLEVGAIVTEPLTISLMKKYPLLETPVSSRTFETSVVSFGLLGPFATTAQLTSQMTPVSQVTLAGVTQKAGTGRVTTGAVFKVERAGKVKRGIVKSESVKLGEIDGTSVIVSGTKGQIYSRGVSFPSGRSILKTKEGFQSAELTGATKLKDFFVTRSAGISKAGMKKSEVYGGVGFGKTGKESSDLIFSGGMTRTLTGDETVSFSLLKNIPSKVKEVSFEPFKSSVSSTRLSPQVSPSIAELKTASLISAKSAVSASVKITPSQPINIFPTPTYNALVTPTKTTTSLETPTKTTSTKTEQINFPMLTETKQITSSRGLTLQKDEISFKQRGKLSSIYSQKVKQPQVQRQPLQVKQISKPLTLQKRLTLQKTIQSQKLKTKTPSSFFSLRTPKPPKKPPVIIPFWRKPKRKLKEKDFKYPVSLRRFGKFRIVGYGKTPKQAIGIGKEQASSTLGATFKVGGTLKLPSKIKGFRTKKTKEGVEFIELPKYRLSKTGEKKEIQFHKRVKKKKKK